MSTTTWEKGVLDCTRATCKVAGVGHLDRQVKSRTPNLGIGIQFDDEKRGDMRIELYTLSCGMRHGGVRSDAGRKFETQNVATREREQSVKGARKKRVRHEAEEGGVLGYRRPWSRGRRAASAESYIDSR